MEKRGLGRGLAALIPEAGGEERGGRVREIPVEQITANPYQPRTLFDPISLAELEGSIREHGILQPILVREVGHERFQIVAGERRYRAACNVGLRMVPVIVKDCGDREQLEMALVENVQREDINAMEAARAYQRLAEEFGLTQDEIAQRVGKKRTSITNTLGLLNLPEEVQDSVERGEISEGHGRALRMAERPDSILEAWRAVVKRRLSVRDTERLARELRERSISPAAFLTRDTEASVGSLRESTLNSIPTADPHATWALEQIHQWLGTKVSLKRASSTTGRIEIEFYSSDELERILDLLIAAGGQH